MATPTYTALATTTLSGSASSVTFSNIDQSYGDLILVESGTTSNSSINTVAVRFNSDSGSNYTIVTMSGGGSSTNSFSGTLTFVSAGYALNTQHTNILQIFDYSATDKYKTALARHNADGVRATANRWANTAAITSITVLTDTGATFNSGTTFSLYGVAK